jgi:hypothetical protein
MKRNSEDDNLYDADGNGPYDPRYPGQRVVADKGRVMVPLYMMDLCLSGCLTRDDRP